MIIRKDQTEAFRQQMINGFEDRMMAHLREAFPDEVRGLDDAMLRETVRHGVRRARQYGIENERDTARFIDLMFLVRRDFDTSPETSWARPILLDKASSAENRLRRLQVKASQHAAAAASSGR
jgi:hypothetical protein